MEGVFLPGHCHNSKIQKCWFFPRMFLPSPPSPVPFAKLQHQAQQASISSCRLCQPGTSCPHLPSFSAPKLFCAGKAMEHEGDDNSQQERLHRPFISQPRGERLELEPRGASGGTQEGPPEVIPDHRRCILHFDIDCFYAQARITDSLGPERARWRLAKQVVQGLSYGQHTYIDVLSE